MGVLIGRYVSVTRKFRADPVSCWMKAGIVCQVGLDEELDCSASASRKRRKKRATEGKTKGRNNAKLEYMLNPAKKSDRTKSGNEARRRYKKVISVQLDTFCALTFLFVQAFDSLDSKAAFPNLFELLWYSQLPCFDVEGVTSDYDGHRSLLKRCTWKGVVLNCSAIFRTFPTDRGMCCAFNMIKADELFKESQYEVKI